MLAVYIILLVLFIVLSVLAFMGKLMAFIADKNIGENEEASYDQRGASNFLGIIMSMLVLSCAVGMLGFALPNMRWLIIAGPIAFVLLLIFALVFINTNNRFASEESDKNSDSGEDIE